MGFGNNNLLWPKYIDVYKFWGWRGEGVHGPPNMFGLLFQKTEKVQEDDLY